MATVNLGRIKPVFKGAYNNSTAYVVDDIVTSGGSSYICIQASTGNAVSNSTYWTLMAQGGTDVGTTLTTEGDILYRDGSGLQRLAIGTANQILQVNSGATALEYTAKPEGKVKQLISVDSSTDYHVNGGETTCTNYNLVITPSSTSSKIIYNSSIAFRISDDGNTGYHEGEGTVRLYRAISGGATTQITADQYGYHLDYISGEGGNQVSYFLVTIPFVDAPNTTSAVTYQTRIYSGNSNYHCSSRHGLGSVMEVV